MSDGLNSLASPAKEPLNSFSKFLRNTFTLRRPESELDQPKTVQNDRIEKNTLATASDEFDRLPEIEEHVTIREKKRINVKRHYQANLHVKNESIMTQNQSPGEIGEDGMQLALTTIRNSLSKKEQSISVSRKRAKTSNNSYSKSEQASEKHSSKGSSTEQEDVSVCHADANQSRMVEQKPARLLTEAYEPMSFSLLSLNQ